MRTAQRSFDYHEVHSARLSERATLTCCLLSILAFPLGIFISAVIN